MCQPLFTFFFSNESEKRPSTDSADSWWRANPWNQRKFLNLKDFSFFFIRNVQSLAIENKYLHGLSPAILNEVFKVNKTIPYDLRMRNELYARNPKTVRCGTETIFLAPKNLVFDTTKCKRLWLLTMFQKKTENGNPTVHVVYTKHFSHMLVLYSSTAARPS